MDQDDYDVWRDDFGDSVESIASLSTPEPGCWGLVLVGVLATRRQGQGL